MLRRLMLISFVIVLMVGFTTAQDDGGYARVFYDISAPGDVYAYALNADDTLTELGQIGSLGEPWAGMRDHYRVSDEIVLAYLAGDTISGLYHLSPDGMTLLDIPAEYVDATRIERFDVSAFRYPYIALTPFTLADGVDSTSADVVPPIIINVETATVAVLPRTIDKFNGYYGVRFAEDVSAVRYAFREEVEGGYSAGGFAVDGIAEYDLSTGEDRLIYEAAFTSQYALFFGSPDGSYWLHDLEGIDPPRLIALDGTNTEIIPYENTGSAIYNTFRVTFPLDCLDADCSVTIQPLNSDNPLVVSMSPLGEFFAVLDLWPVPEEVSIMGLPTEGDTQSFMALGSGSVNDYALHFVRVQPGADAELIGMVANDMIQSGDPFTPDGRYALLFDSPASTTLRFVDTYTNTDIYTTDAVSPSDVSWAVFSNGMAFRILDGITPGGQNLVYHYATNTLKTPPAGEVIDMLPDDRYILATLDRIQIINGAGEVVAEVPANGTPIISREARNYLLYFEG